jgi:hypothetical protein
LLFDQNLPRRLPALLAAEFPGSEQVLLAGLAQADDQSASPLSCPLYPVCVNCHLVFPSSGG